MQKDGYTFISADEALQTEEYAGYQKIEGGTLSEYQFPGLISSTPTGYAYLIKKTTDSGKEKGGFNGYKLSAQLGGALVAKLNINVLFIEDAESGFSKAASDAVGGVAKIVVRPNLRVAITKTYQEFYFAEKEIKPLAFTKIELKEDLLIPEIFEDKKYKAAESSQTDNWGYQYGTMRLFNVTDTYLEKTIPLPCEANKYRDGVSAALKSYVDAIFSLYRSY